MKSKSAEGKLDLDQNIWFAHLWTRTNGLFGFSTYSEEHEIKILNAKK